MFYTGLTGQCLCRCSLVECREALYQGDRDCVFQILDWLFTEQQRQPGLLHKRAFVGYYLGIIDVSAPVLHL